MKTHFYSLIFFLLLSISLQSQTKNKNEVQINQLMDNWHKAAADCEFDTYFSMMTSDAIFIGTDATENWDIPAFKKYAKPHFDQKKAWNFTALERHIFFDSSGKMAWFDELLDTQMKICRGSGVLIKVGNDWKIKHYVLSMTIPNAVYEAVTTIKSPIEDALITQLKAK